MKQPKQLFILSFVQLWKFFSHYGNRALLMLFMVESLGLSDQKAFGIYALYAGLFEMGGLLGGFIADRFLGVRRALMLGAALIGVGHLIFAFQGGFIMGLSWIVVGTSLFSPNMTALLGSFYEKGDTRRESGFTLFYMVMNVGALLSTLICPLVAAYYGWHYGFGIAAIGMLIGIVTLFIFSHQLRVEEVSIRPVKTAMLLIALFVATFVSLQLQQFLLPLLPFVVIALFVIMLRSMAKQIITPLLALVCFFAIQEQIGSSLLIFTERFVPSSVPSSILLAINPLVVLVLGSVLAKMTGKIRLILPFALMGVVFALLGSMTLAKLSVPIGGMMAVIGVISIAELLIGPYVFSSISEVSTKGTVMGMIPLGFSLAALLGGGISKGVACHYGYGFCLISICLIIIAICFGRLYAVRQNVG